jgi:Cysteine-rich secretory protein family
MLYIIAHGPVYTVLAAFAITNAMASSDSDAYVGAHNAKRKLHERTLPLQYDALLESSAKTHTDQCQFRLSEPNDDIGENLARGFSTWDSAINAWYAGINYYDSQHPTDNTTKTNRFTQVVWKATTKVGCSMNTTCSNGPLITCHYSPSGNWIEEYTENVMPLIGGRKLKGPQHTAVIL